MIWKNGGPISPPTIKPCSNLSTNFWFSFSVTLRFSAASPCVTSKHSSGGLSLCRLRESWRAKYSPHRSQKWISSGCVSEVLQCRLYSPKSLTSVPRQTPHLIAWTAPRSESASDAWGNNLCIGLNLRGILKNFIASSCCWTIPSI